MNPILAPQIGLSAEEWNIVKNTRRIYDAQGHATGPVGANGVAGIRCKTQFGLLILGIVVTNLENEVVRIDEKVMDATATTLTTYALAGGTCRLRNVGSGPGVGIPRGAAQAFTAKPDTLAAWPNIAQVGLVYLAAYAHTEFERAIFLERDDHYYLCHITQAKAFRVGFYGLEFITEEERDFWKSWML